MNEHWAWPGSACSAEEARRDRPICLPCCVLTAQISETPLHRLNAMRDAEWGGTWHDRGLQIN